MTVAVKVMAGVIIFALAAWIWVCIRDLWGGIKR